VGIWGEKGGDQIGGGVGFACEDTGEQICNKNVIEKTYLEIGKTACFKTLRRVGPGKGKTQKTSNGTRGRTLRAYKKRKDAKRFVKRKEPTPVGRKLY